MVNRVAFLRGASKQYDLLTHSQISIFLRSPEQKPVFSSSRVLITARAALQASGLPPKVEP